MSSLDEERIVMTPKKKTARSTTLMMERKLVTPPKDSGQVHVAGGSNTGFVVNKRQIGIEENAGEASHISLEFRVFLVNAATKKFTQEKRVISYWFKTSYEELLRPGTAQDFFKQLVSPIDFPRDYVGFIKKIMKLMQAQYPMLSKIEVTLTQEKDMDQLPSQPSEEDEKKKDEEVKTENVLKNIEEAYPNSLTIDDMACRFKTESEVIRSMVLELVSKKLVKPVGAGVPGTDSGASAFRRVHQNEDQVTVVKHMPKGLEKSLHPTIAVITSKYHEKMAVDAVMTNKRTFMRYATNGEANVYTLGDLGSHRVVSTKLPMTGRSRDALIATGSTTTRLLGTFQGVEHVFLVGLGGAVPHYTDYAKHVRLGDIVISAPPLNGDKKFIYEYCESVKESPKDGSVTFESRSWCPPDLGLQQIARRLIEEWEANPSEADWKINFSKALEELKVEEGTWQRPDPQTDKLYMSAGGSDIIEVGHPAPSNPEKEDPRCIGEPVIHLGPIAAGRQVALDDRLRQAFASRHEIKAYDAELDAVVESIYGNRKDQYMLIRGMSDYGDGSSSSSREWKQYSALMAASVLKSIVDRMPPPPLI